MIGVLFLNGDKVSKSLFARHAGGFSLAVAADGAFAYAQKLCKIDAIVGDMDSIQITNEVSGIIKNFSHPALTGTPQEGNACENGASQDSSPREGNNASWIVYPTDKDKIDGELGLRYLIERGCKDVKIFGAGGGRDDHWYANLNLLKIAFDLGARGQIVTNRCRIDYVAATNNAANAASGDGRLRKSSDTLDADGGKHSGAAGNVPETHIFPQLLSTFALPPCVPPPVETVFAQSGGVCYVTVSSDASEVRSDAVCPCEEGDARRSNPPGHIAGIAASRSRAPRNDDRLTSHGLPGNNAPSFVYTAQAKAGRTVSLLPFGDRAHILDTEGLKYRLTDFDLQRDTLGVSNVVTGGTVKVSVGEGALLVFWVL